MIYRSLLLIAALASCIAFVYLSDRTISGVVVDDGGQPLIYATVQVKGSTTGTQTDLDGRFEIRIPLEDTVWLVVSYVGYESKEVAVRRDMNDVRIALTEAASLEEVVIKEYSVPLVKRSSSSSGSTRTPAPARATDISIRGSRAGASEYYVDGRRVKGTSADGPHGEKAVAHVEIADPSAGQITAGEWNDADNWSDWETLMDDPNYNKYQKHWQMFPSQRYSVLVLNQNDVPVPNSRVLLKDCDGQTIWAGRTDNRGKAEIWGALFDQTEVPCTIEVEGSGDRQTSRHLVTVEQGVNEVRLREQCPEESALDICFVVDATGSMRDEIRYLQSELRDVLERVGGLDGASDMRVGSVFYRDKTDAYLTNVQPFSSDADETLAFLKRQQAGGGGDYPEAVDEALAQALDMEWRDHGTKLLFLLLDAPPHHRPEVLERMRRLTRKAAEKGVKIIPITASGINRETEFLMKFLALATSGTYVFITDDSGIGNPHLDPVVDDYSVEFLNDLLVRLIRSYATIPACDEAKTKKAMAVRVFPNPTSNVVHVELDRAVDALRVLSASGRTLIEKTAVDKGRQQLELGQLIGGVYTLQIVQGSEEVFKNVILIRN